MTILHPSHSTPSVVPLNTLHHFAHHWDFVVGDEQVSHIPNTCDIFEVCELALHGGAETEGVADRVREIARAGHERGVPIDVNRTIWMADARVSVLDLMVRSKFYAGAYALLHPYHVTPPLLTERDEEAKADDDVAQRLAEQGHVVAHVQSNTLHACLASACAMDDVCAGNVLTRCASPSRLLRVWLTPWRCPHTRVVFPTLLHFAVRHGSWKVMRLVLHDLAADESVCGALVNRLHRMRRDVLALACEAADYTCVLALLECDALVRSRPAGAAGAAAGARQRASASFALDGRTFATAIKACITSVSAQSESSRVEVLVELLSAQARLVRARYRNRDVECALARAAMLACEHGRAACLRAVLQHANELDAALFSGGALTRRVLLGGKKVDSTSGMAFTAARCRDAGCLRVLAEYGGVDVRTRYELEVHDARGEAETRSLLHLACEWGSADAARVLLAAGARADETCAGGWTALHFAAASHVPTGELVDVLVAGGCPMEATTEATEAAPPCTASMIAAARGNADALRRLLAVADASGTRRSADDEARAMRCALERGHTACARALIERGVDAFADAAAMRGDGEGTTAPLSAWPGGEAHKKEGDDAMARLLASAKRVRAGWLWRRARDVVARGVVRMRRGDGRADGAGKKRKRE